MGSWRAAGVGELCEPKGVCGSGGCSRARHGEWGGAVAQGSMGGGENQRAHETLSFVSTHWSYSSLQIEKGELIS